MRKLVWLVIGLMTTIFGATNATAGLLTQDSPIPTTYTLGVDFELPDDDSMRGFTTGLLQNVDLSTGCNRNDFTSFIPGNIALIERGICAFTTKAENAALAGASGALIYNSRDGLLSPVARSEIPLLFITRDLGLAFVGQLEQTVAVQVSMRVSAVPTPATLSMLALGLLGLRLRKTT